MKEEVKSESRDIKSEVKEEPIAILPTKTEDPIKTEPKVETDTKMPATINLADDDDDEDELEAQLKSHIIDRDALCRKPEPLPPPPPVVAKRTAALSTPKIHQVPTSQPANIDAKMYLQQLNMIIARNSLLLSPLFLNNQQLLMNGVSQAMIAQQLQQTNAALTTTNNLLSVANAVPQSPLPTESVSINNKPYNLIRTPPNRKVAAPLNCSRDVVNGSSSTSNNIICDTIKTVKSEQIKSETAECPPRRPSKADEVKRLPGTSMNQEQHSNIITCSNLGELLAQKMVRLKHAFFAL